MSSPSPRRKAPSKTLAVAAAVIALIAVVFLRMGEDGGAGPGAPPVHFQTGTIKASSTGGEAHLADAQAVLPEIRRIMQDFYQEAFLDPATWKSGDYDPAWSKFTPEAAQRAKEHLEVLTLGAHAGEDFDSIQPRPSLLGLRVLTNEHGKPLSAFALVTFAADAKTSAGEPHEVVSVGSFSLEPSGDSWRITGFQVHREDDTYGSSPSPVPGGTGTSVGLAHPSSWFPAHDGTDPLFFLVIGDSYRAGQSHLADSIHIVAFDPSSGDATVLGIPRDSWVPIPGHGTQKINAAFALGGPKLMIDTVEQLTGLRMDYYAVTTFDGFISIIKAVGGLDIKVPYDIHDPGSKSNLHRGPARLSGKDTLRFARSRDDVPNGDFSRQYNEGLILMAMLQQFQGSFRESPSATLNWLGAGMQNVDTDLSWDQVLALAYLAARVKPSQITNLVVPGRIGHAGDQSIVEIDAEAANQIFDDLADGRLDSEHEGADV